jgi:predicted nucleic acid-binding protein
MPVDQIENLPQGTDVLIDANIFIYALGHASPLCVAFLERCAREEVLGVTTVEVVNEVTHRLMLVEALKKNHITKEQASQLKEKPNAIKGLADYWTLASRIFALNVLILGLEVPRLQRGERMRKAHGLLTNDSMVLAAIDEYGIGSLATRDGDFDQVPGIVVYKPGDI